MKEKKHLSILLPATVICILAVTIYFQMTNGTISVSNTVNGKELPIYCVDTQEPKISIFSLTVALIASKPGARSLRGSYPLPC